MKKVSKEEYKELVDTVLALQKSLEGQLGLYTANTISRLIIARIDLANSTIQQERKKP